MNVTSRLAVLAVVSFIVTFATSPGAATSTIGILVFDGFLSSDVTAPVEVFGAASKKASFSSYKVVVISATREKELADSFPKIKVQFDRNVVVDNKVITSNGGPVSYQAAFELLAKLSSEKFANEISESIQFAGLRNAFK